MRLHWSDMLGLAVGFLLGGIALTVLLPVLTDEAPQAAPHTTPGPTATPDTRRPGHAAESAPTVVTQGAKPPALPNVNYPTPPKPGAGVSGTGFFISSDGSLLTAAHVAGDCRRRRIVSREVPIGDADLIAVDATLDLALLRAERRRAPWVLPLAAPGRDGVPVRVFGYPAEGDPIIPTETTGRIRSAPAGAYAGLIRIEAAAITQGFSGGPVLDAASQVVVGLIQATVHRPPGRPPSGAVPQHAAIGPDRDRIVAFLRREAPWLDVAADTARLPPAGSPARAVVHVLCIR